MKETNHPTLQLAHFNNCQTFFHYDLQVWIKDGLIQDCGHPNCLDKTKDQECNQHKYQGKSLEEITSAFWTLEYKEI